MRTLITLALAALGTPLAAGAQSGLRIAPSGRATTQVSLAPPRVEGAPAPTLAPSIIKVDYGQPHARGRTVLGALAADLGKVWRLGANEPTSFTTDVDLTVGGVMIPKGTYTLLAETTDGAWKLIVNRASPASEARYDAALDLARIPLRSRQLAVALESLTIWLVPAGAESLEGELRIAWGTLEHSVAWSVAPSASSR
ncbi:MAG: DUF2911 domain-containing protein [Gemmatimonadaceae bacterium]